MRDGVGGGVKIGFTVSVNRLGVVFFKLEEKTQDACSCFHKNVLYL